MGPIDYNAGIQDPFMTGMQLAKMGSEVQANESQMQQEKDRTDLLRQKADADAEKARLDEDRAQKIQTGMEDIVNKGFRPTYQDVMKLAALSRTKEQEDKINSFWEATDKNTREEELKHSGQVVAGLFSKNPAAGIQLLKDKGTALRNSGKVAEAEIYENMASDAAEDPYKVGTLQALSTAHFPGGDKILEQALKMNPNSEGNIEVHSNKFLANGGSIIVTKDGKTIVKDADGKVLEGAERTAAIQGAGDYEVEQKRREGEATRTGQLQAEIDLGGKAKRIIGNVDQSFKLADDASAQIDKIDANILNLDEAIRLVDVEKATTGVLANKFPSWKGATIELRQVQRKLGLDVIGSTTFGALSKGELDLALDTAMPTDLEGPELSKWLHKKKDAQEKLSAYLAEQVEYISKPENAEKGVAGWRAFKTEQKKKDKTKSKTAGSEVAPVKSVSAKLDALNNSSFANFGDGG